MGGVESALASEYAAAGIIRPAETVKVQGVALSDGISWRDIARYFNGDVNEPTTLTGSGLTQGQVFSAGGNEFERARAEYCTANSEMVIQESGGGGDCGFYSILAAKLWFIFLDFIDYGRGISEAFEFTRDFRADAFQPAFIKINPVYVNKYAQQISDKHRRYKRLAPNVKPQYDIYDSLITLNSIDQMRRVIYKTTQEVTSNEADPDWLRNRWLDDEGMAAITELPGVEHAKDNYFKPFNYTWVFTNDTENLAPRPVTLFPAYSHDALHTLKIDSNRDDRHRYIAAKGLENIGGKYSMHFRIINNRHIQPILPISLHVEHTYVGTTRKKVSYTQKSLFLAFLYYFTHSENMRPILYQSLTNMPLPEALRKDIDSIYQSWLANKPMLVGRTICQGVEQGLESTKVMSGFNAQRISLGLNGMIQEFIRASINQNLLETDIKTVFKREEDKPIERLFREYMTTMVSLRDGVSLARVTPIGDVNVEKLIVLCYLRAILNKAAKTLPDTNGYVQFLWAEITDIRNKIQVEEIMTQD